MAHKKTKKRSDSEDKEYLRGVIRKKDKRIKLLEREVARLTKYLMQVDFEVTYNDDDEPYVMAPIKEGDWVCKRCGSKNYDELILPQRHLIRKYITCKNCGDRTRETIDD